MARMCMICVIYKIPLCVFYGTDGCVRVVQLFLSCVKCVIQVRCVIVLLVSFQDIHLGRTNYNEQWAPTDSVDTGSMGSTESVDT